jgi:hypothetical protein
MAAMGRLIQLLMLIVLALVVWRLLRKLLGPRELPPPASPPAPGTPGYAPTARCGQCGTHVPREQLDAAGLCPRCR